MQQGVNAGGLPLTESVGISVADINTSTAVATPPGLGGSDGGLTSYRYRGFLRIRPGLIHGK